MNKDARVVKWSVQLILEPRIYPSKFAIKIVELLPNLTCPNIELGWVNMVTLSEAG